jgi:vacuolar-type H+-ATPase subunit F/Vma7
MEYSLNTCIRNKYKNFLIKGFIEIYEEETLKKIAKVKKVSKNYQFALINFNDKTINEIKKIYDNSSKKSLILIVNLKNKKTKKEIMSYLKLLKIRHEFQKIGQGIILIAK